MAAAAAHDERVMRSSGKVSWTADEQRYFHRRLEARGRMVDELTLATASEAEIRDCFLAQLDNSYREEQTGTHHGPQGRHELLSREHPSQRTEYQIDKDFDVFPNQATSLLLLCPCGT